MSLCHKRSRRGGGAYVPTFFVGMYAPLVRAAHPLTLHGTPSIANRETSFRK